MTAGLGGIELSDLQSVVGQANARPAVGSDTVDGVPPRFVVEPGDASEVSDVLRLASGVGMAVVPRGSGSKLGWGNPPRRLDVVLSTRRLNRLIAHESGDLVVIAGAGMTVAALQQAVAPAGQMLAIDPLQAEATLGGTIAANASGPLRLRYGTMRDLLIGITVVLADGTVARSGGKVVKNVAGYDLGKLFTGSLGTLGVIVETIFRLHPLPQTDGIAVLHVDRPQTVRDAVAAILHSSLVPVAVELQWQDRSGRLAVAFAGIEPSVAAQSDEARNILAGLGRVEALSGSEVRSLWADLYNLRWNSGADRVGLKIATVPSKVGDAIEGVEEVSRKYSLKSRIAGQAATTVLFVALQGKEDDLVRAIAGLRGRFEGADGSVFVLDAPVSVKRQIDVWGSAGDALWVMQRVKEQFDPAGVMSPGRFIGGL
jgi:glycolate oxidase FAD binding subunit